MLDVKDRHIIRLLQQNSRMTSSEVAAEVNLSVPAAAERIRKLLEAGIIQSFGAHVDARRLGFGLTAFITVVSASSDHYQEITTLAIQDKRILECHSVTGEGSHLLKVRVQNSSVLEKLLRDIQAWPGVIRSHTVIALSTFKESLVLDIE